MHGLTMKSNFNRTTSPNYSSESAKKIRSGLSLENISSKSARPSSALGARKSTGVNQSSFLVKLTDLFGRALNSNTYESWQQLQDILEHLKLETDFPLPSQQVNI